MPSQGDIHLAGKRPDFRRGDYYLVRTLIVTTHNLLSPWMDLQHEQFTKHLAGEFEMWRYQDAATKNPPSNVREFPFPLHELPVNKLGSHKFGCFVQWWERLNPRPNVDFVLLCHGDFFPVENVDLDKWLGGFKQYRQDWDGLNPNALVVTRINGGNGVRQVTEGEIPYNGGNLGQTGPFLHALRLAFLQVNPRDDEARFAKVEEILGRTLRLKELVAEKQALYFAPPLRGLGDVVANVTSAVGIKPCGGCKQRQEKLNQLVPFGSKNNL
jgi:hypothetical protein